MNKNNYDDFYRQLYADGFISNTSFAQIKQQKSNPLFSVHWEIKTIIYLGILLLTGGIGILVYKNIDTIGHQVILLFIALLSGGCISYCFKHKKPFSTAKVQTPNTFFDYVLLLGTISLVTFVGYIQYQYNVFGNNYGMATFIPMLALFYIAYSFDHVGILNMAIANLGVWMGVTVTPKQLLSAGNFNSQSIIGTYLSFGLLLLLFAWLSQKLIIKKHFKFSYQHYGIHVSFVSLLAGYFFNYESAASMLWLLGLFVLATALYYDAFKEKSFYFLLLAVLYSYFAVSCILVRGLVALNDIGAYYLLFMYFIGSAIGLIFLLIHLNKKIKSA
ncbi:DUF2157 domain-containing protein [Mucilaginibacter terrae]|uniref:DUF2157 domain-containing protein n=1 Tax=Mucilaginibacter terrae TaxID=1955052 RepID=UPI00363A9A72